MTVEALREKKGKTMKRKKKKEMAKRKKQKKSHKTQEKVTPLRRPVKPGHPSLLRPSTDTRLKSL